MRVAVTGSHGLIGSELVRALESRGDQVTRIVRSHEPGTVRWDVDSGQINAPALEGHDAVVHLAGAGIGDHRWTEDHKRAVLDSRVKGTTLLSEALAGLDRPPAVLVSGSAVGYYGDRGDEVLDEGSPPGSGFLAEVVQAWEAATAPAQAAGVRVAHIRTGVVLSPTGGALKRQLLPFKLGIGGRLGSGRQWLSWITLSDEVAVIEHVIAHEDVGGPVNLTAPSPVTNSDFTRALGSALRRPAVLPTPTLALKALFGSQMVSEMLLAGQRVEPRALESSGFVFRHPEIGEALRALF